MLAGAAALLERVREVTDASFELVPLSSEAPALMLDAAIAASAPRDLALVRSGVRVCPGWVERLRAAAHSDSTIASATPFGIRGAGISLLVPGKPGLAQRRQAGRGPFASVAPKSCTRRPRLLLRPA